MKIEINHIFKINISKDSHLFANLLKMNAKIDQSDNYFIIKVILQILYGNKYKTNDILKTKFCIDLFSF